MDIDCNCDGGGKSKDEATIREKSFIPITAAAFLPGPEDKGNTRLTLSLGELVCYEDSELIINYA